MFYQWRLVKKLWNFDLIFIFLGENGSKNKKFRSKIRSGSNNLWFLLYIKTVIEIKIGNLQFTALKVGIFIEFFILNIFFM